MSEGNKLILGVVVVVMIIFGYFLYSTASQKYVSNKSQPSASATGSNASSGQNTESAYAILTPAKVPPKVAECSQSISFNSNGTSGPVQCSNGELNTLEWESLAALEPSVLTLGYNASFSQVQSALCSDVKANISNPIELIVYQIAALYYGWNFSSNPSSILTNGTCVNVDD